jgi:hypothetical protein
MIIAKAPPIGVDEICGFDSVNRAFVRVRLVSGRTLFLCGLCAQLHLPKLKERSTAMFDENGDLSWPLAHEKLMGR